MSLEENLTAIKEAVEEVASCHQQMLQCTKGNLVANLVYQANQIQAWRDFAKTEAEAEFFGHALQRHKMLAANYGFALNELPKVPKSDDDKEHHF
jgi:hypothetical protein